jgi:hypothetical protein
MKWNQFNMPLLEQQAMGLPQELNGLEAWENSVQIIRAGKASSLKTMFLCFVRSKDRLEATAGVDWQERQSKEELVDLDTTSRTQETQCASHQPRQQC